MTISVARASDATNATRRRATSRRPRRDARGRDGDGRDARGTRAARAGAREGSIGRIDEGATPSVTTRRRAMASLVRAMVNGTAVVNATKVQELLNDVDAAMDWKNDALRYLWATASAVSTFMWFGFAGDNLQYYRMNGGLAYAGGATNRSVWAESFGKSGVFLLAYRACATAACAYYEVREKIAPRLTVNAETEMYGLDMSYFLNLHDWTVHSVTLFFFFATLASLAGMCSRTATHDHYLGHSGRCNTLGHWVMALYTIAFTMSVSFLVIVLFEAAFAPQCVPSSARGKLTTFLDPASRLCYLEPQYMIGYLGNVLLLLIEASLGRLVFPKCYMSQPIFYASTFFIIGQFNVMVLNGDWAYQWTNYWRRETVVYLNAFLCLVMFTHLVLVKFLRANSNSKLAKNVEERVPLFM